MSNFLRPHGLYSPWNSLGQNTGMGSLSLLQGIFLAQELILSGVLSEAQDGDEEDRPADILSEEPGLGALTGAQVRGDEV